MSAISSKMRALARVSFRATVPRTALSAARPSVLAASRMYRQAPVGIRAYSDDARMGESADPERQSQAMVGSGEPEPAEKRTMFIGNLDYGLTNEEIAKEISHLGEVQNIVRINRSAARIIFPDAATTDAAIQQINGSFWRGRRVYAMLSRPPLNGGSSEAHPPSRTLFIGNIPHDATDLELSEALGCVPSIPFLRLLRDHQTGMFRGFGYADFYTVAEAERAKELLYGKTVRGSQLRVNFAKTTQQTEDALERRIRTYGIQGDGQGDRGSEEGQGGQGGQQY